MKKGLSGNALKIIAALSMLIDHAGLMLFPQLPIFRIIGRLAFPVFAYMIAEGVRHTKNRKRYLKGLLFLALLCQSVYFAVDSSIYMNVLVTFSLSVITIYTVEAYIKRKSRASAALAALWLFALAFFLLCLPHIVKGFCVDYGFFGVTLPVAVYFAKDRQEKLIGAAIVLTALCTDIGGVQWYSLFSIPLLCLYNGERGGLPLKSFFYIFYPVHLALLWLLKQFI